MTNQYDTYVVDEEERKAFPWGRIIGAILVIALLIWLGFMAVKSMNTLMARNAEAAVAAAIAEMQPVVTDERTTEVEKMIGSNPGKDTYFPELSCSHLESCQITEVPQGYFTVGFTDNGHGCDWTLFNEGESIDYENLDEIHTYNNLLPLTRLEGFVASQFTYVLACTVNN